MIFSFVISAALASRTVLPAGAGPNRLDPDVALLSTAAPLRYTVNSDRERRYMFQGGLDDLRLHDGSGRELQYLLVPPPLHTPSWRSASILPIASSKTTSGFEADLGTIVSIDRIAIKGVATPFLKRLQLEGSGDRARWTMLASEATVFDLPEQQLRNLEVDFAPGDYRYFRVIWDDRSSARVRFVGSVAARIQSNQTMPLPVGMAVPFRKKASELTKSRYRIALPGPHLPITAIELQVSNTNVLRDASISEPRLDGNALMPVELGSARLRRAERDGMVASEMSVPISFPRGSDLDLVIDDGNSGPLTINAAIARLAPLPWIYFESADGAAITATYGDASLAAPRYDLEASRQSVERMHPVPAQWSTTTAPRSEDARRAALPLVGATIDRKPFRYSRLVGSLPAGLTVLVLDADVLAHSQSLDDVRLVDSNGKQVPYLLEKRDAPLTITLPVPRRAAGTATTSIYRFALPYDRFPSGTRLIITTSARIFDRSVTLERPADESHGRDPVVLESAQWRSTDPESPVPALTFSAPLIGTSSVELRVDEGDNAPLPITSAQLLLPSYAIRFVSSGTPLTLLYGDPSASAPRYDLALLASQLLSESAHEVSLAPTTPRTNGEPTQRERALFWSVIVAATIVLLITLGRLLSDRLSEAGA